MDASLPVCLVQNLLAPDQLHALRRYLLAAWQWANEIINDMNCWFPVHVHASTFFFLENCMYQLDSEFLLHCFSRLRTFFYRSQSLVFVFLVHSLRFWNFTLLYIHRYDFGFSVSSSNLCFYFSLPLIPLWSCCDLCISFLLACIAIELWASVTGIVWDDSHDTMSYT